MEYYMEGPMELLHSLCEHLSDIKIDWHLCGGLAIDVYLGKKTRTHKDIDITVSYDDMKACIDFLLTKEWTIDAPVGKKRLVPIDYALSRRDLHFDNIWCYKECAEFLRVEKIDGIFKYMNYEQREQTELDFIEIIFNRIEDDTFYYKRNFNITSCTDKAFIKIGKLSILAPEIVLLYKSTDHENINNKHDYEVVINHMRKDRYDWLMNALQVIYPKGHPWIR
jgi:hypothetical protein